MAHRNSSLHPDIQQFVECLQQIHGLLAADHEEFWRHRIHKVIEIANKSDSYSVELFLGFFGGMGSFSDLVLNGSDVSNSTLHELRSKAYKIAYTLR